MARFSISDVVLKFNPEYNKLLVLKKGSLELLEQFELNKDKSALAITVDQNDYLLEAKEWNGPARHAWEVTNDLQLTFMSAVLDGIGIVDIRDMRSDKKSKVSYQLSCCEFRLSYHAGPFALRIDFDKDTCVQVENP